MIIKEINFETIVEIWREKLWPNRKEPIKPTNNIAYLGGRNSKINEQTPVFFAAYKDNTIVGVNSGFSTLDGGFRSRGIWVTPSCRNERIGNALLTSVIEYAKVCNNDYVWSMPRQSALPCYLSAGFIQTSKFFDQGVEFGPNCFVRLDLNER